MANENIKFYQDELTSAFTLTSAMTSYTDIGLEITVTTGASEWVEIESRGQIANSSGDNFSILLGIDIDGTIEKEWYHADTGDTLHRKPFHIFKRIQLSAGSHTIKIRAWNNQGSNVSFSSSAEQKCFMTVDHYTNN